MTQSDDRFRMPCGHCEGRGTVELPQHLKRTYAACAKLVEAGQPVTSIAVAKLLRRERPPPKPTAINNRLAVLEQLRLIVRTGRAGHRITYALWWEDPT